jgi:hypothetical protein
MEDHLKILVLSNTCQCLYPRTSTPPKWLPASVVASMIFWGIALNQMPRVTNVTQTNEDREPWCNIFPHSKSCGTISEQTDLTHSTWTPSRPKGDPPSFGDLWQSSSEHLQPQPFLKQSLQLKHCLGPQLATARINIYVTWLSEVCAFSLHLSAYVSIYICSQITNMDINIYSRELKLRMRFQFPKFSVEHLEWGLLEWVPATFL